MTDTSGNSAHELAPDRETRILDDLQDAVQRMHMLATSPRVVFATGVRHQGARPMAWQALFERTVGGAQPSCRYRGAPASALTTILSAGADQQPTGAPEWSHAQLRDAMAAGPIIQAFRNDRLAETAAPVLIGAIIFEEDGLTLRGVRAMVKKLGLR